MIRQSYYSPSTGTHVKLDEYISDLNLDISPEGYSCQPMCKDGFAYMWAGAKATHGVRRGKVCFEVKVAEELEVSTADFTNIHVARVGWSTDSATLQLGEDKYSYGYGGTAKKSEARRFADYGRRFAKGDVIGCYLSIENGWAEIFYCVNGRHCGSAFKVKWSAEEALFPHILTKNCRLEINFGQAPNPYFSLQPGFKLIDHIPVELRVPAVRPPGSKRECEVIMMVGLPGVGKSTWAMNYCKLHPSKKYNILGTDAIIDKMRVQGLPRKNNFGGRWDVLIKQASECFNALLKKASNCNRNLILDQTNVYASARKRKVRQYKDAGYTMNAMVLVPTDEEMMRRSKQRTVEEGKEVPEAAVFDMKANFSLPHEDENLFNNITFLELQRDEAENLVIQYNTDANMRGYKSNKQSGVGANQNQQEKNQLNKRQFKPDSRPSPRDSSRSRDLSNDAWGKEDSRNINSPRDDRSRSRDGQERKSRWDRQDKSPRAEARKRPDDERRTGPPEKYRRDSSPLHANPPSGRSDDRQVGRAPPPVAPPQVGMYNQNHGRRSDLPPAAPRNLPARSMPPQQPASFKRESDITQHGFPVAERPQHAQTSLIKQEQYYNESKSPKDMDWQYSDQRQHQEEEYGVQNVYGRNASQSGLAARGGPLVKQQFPGSGVPDRPRTNPHDVNARNQHWEQHGGAGHSYPATGYDDYGPGPAKNQPYEGNSNQGGWYGRNQQQDQNQGEQYGDDYNYQGQDDTDQAGYGQDEYGQDSEQYFQNAEGEHYGDDGGQWNQQDNYQSETVTYTDENKWGNTAEYNVKSEMNQGYQDDQGYGQYDENNWNTHGGGENWAGDQDQYNQGGQTDDYQSQSWEYGGDQQGEYSNDQQGGDGVDYNKQADMSGSQQNYGQQIWNRPPDKPQNSAMDGRFSGQQDFGRGPGNNFIHGRSAAEGGQNRFPGREQDDAWGRDNASADQGEFGRKQWSQPQRGYTDQPKSAQPAGVEYSSGFDRPSGPQSAPWQQRPRPDAFASDHRPGQFDNRNHPGPNMPSSRAQSGAVPEYGGNRQSMLSERPAFEGNKEFSRPKPADRFAASREGDGPIRPPQQSFSGRSDERRTNLPLPGPRGGNGGWPAQDRGSNSNRDQVRQPSRPSDEMSESALSKLISVDFDKLKASLANLRQAQQVQPERKHPYDLSDKEILDMTFPSERPAAGNAPFHGAPNRGFGGHPQRPGGSGDGPRRPPEPPGRRPPRDSQHRGSPQDQRRDFRGGRVLEGPNDRGKPAEPRGRSPPTERRARDTGENRPLGSDRRGPNERDGRPSPKVSREKQAPGIGDEKRRTSSPREHSNPGDSRDRRPPPSDSRNRSNLPVNRDRPISAGRDRNDDRRRSDRAEDRDRRDDRDKRDRGRDRDKREPSGDRGRSAGLRDERKQDTRDRRLQSPVRDKGSLSRDKAMDAPPKRSGEVTSKREPPKVEVSTKQPDARREGWNQLKAAETLIMETTGLSKQDLPKNPPSLMQLPMSRPTAALRPTRPIVPKEKMRPPVPKDPPLREPRPLVPRPKAGLLETPRPSLEEKQLIEELALEEFYAKQLNSLVPRPRGPRPFRPGLRARPPLILDPHLSRDGPELNLLGEEPLMRRPRLRPPHSMGPRLFPGDMPRRLMRPRLPGNGMRRPPLMGERPLGMRSMRPRMHGPRPSRGLLDHPPRPQGLLRFPRGVRPRHPLRPHFAA